MDFFFILTGFFRAVTSSSKVILRRNCKMIWLNSSCQKKLADSRISIFFILAANIKYDKASYIHSSIISLIAVVLLCCVVIDCF